jgi:hypothetical protein
MAMLYRDASGGARPGVGQIRVAVSGDYMRKDEGERKCVKHTDILFRI